MNREEWHRRFWDRWPRREELRERDPEKRVHTALVWRTIERYLTDVKTVLDAGAGPGRFSLPLAQRGFKVTHLDLAPAMLARARKQAAQAGIELEFVLGKVEALPWRDRRFDLVLCLDAPVSYASSAGQALQELARVTGRWLILSVVNRLGQLPVGIKVESTWRADLAFSRAFWTGGDWEPPPGLARLPFLGAHLFPPLHAFTPAELEQALGAAGLEPVEIAATGTLARLVGRRALRRIWRKSRLRAEFLAMCEEVERLPEIRGVGAEVAAGLLAVCRRRPAEPS